MLIRYKGWCTADTDSNCDESPTLETLDFTIRIGSTASFLYFDLHMNTAYMQHTTLNNIQHH